MRISVLRASNASPKPSADRVGCRDPPFAGTPVRRTPDPRKGRDRARGPVRLVRPVRRPCVKLETRHEVRSDLDMAKGEHRVAPNRFVGDTLDVRRHDRDVVPPAGAQGSRVPRRRATRSERRGPRRSASIVGTREVSARRRYRQQSTRRVSLFHPVIHLGSSHTRQRPRAILRAYVPGSRTSSSSVAQGPQRSRATEIDSPFDPTRA